MVISISALFSSIALWISQTGVVSKILGWIGTLGITTLLIYGFWFGKIIRRAVNIVISIFLILVALAFAYQAGMLPSWLPFIIVW